MSLTDNEFDAAEVSVEQNAGTSRRALVKGAAWSVPIVAAAVATPAASASPAPEPEFQFTSSTVSATQNPDGSYGNIALSNGNFTITGPVGRQSGAIEIQLTAPTGYTATHIGTTTPLQVGDSINAGWTVSGGPTTWTFTHPGVTIGVGETQASAWFQGADLLGSGADSDNQARFRYRFTGISTGWTASYVPEDD